LDVRLAKVAGSTSGRIAIAYLILASVIVCGQVNHRYNITNTKFNSAFHPSGVSKSSTVLSGWGYGGTRYMCRVAGTL